MLDDFDDDDDTDPWNLDSKNKPVTKTADVKPLDLKTPVITNPAAAASTNAQKKADNPFDQKVKPAFDDLEDIGFELDSDRPVEFNNQKKPETAKKEDIFAKKAEKDDGLIADNDFGDDFGDDDYYQEDFEDDSNKKPGKGAKEAAAAEEDIFNKS